MEFGLTTGIISKMYKDSMGRWLRRELFIDAPINHSDGSRPPVFCLFGERPGLISAQKTFVQEGDPTGYRWAMKYLGAFEHWLRLLESNWFREALDIWQKELAAKEEAEMRAILREIAKDSDNKSQLAAAKYLNEQARLRDGSPKRGRPSKAEVDGELKKELDRRKADESDLERIGGLKVIEGGKSGTLNSR